MASIFADKDKLIELANTSSSILEMIHKAGLKANNGGSSHKTVRKWAAIHGVELPKFTQADAAPRRKSKHTIETMFVAGSHYNNDTLKRNILKHDLLPYVCANIDCQLSDTWLGVPLSLQLEHINGKNNDNRIENLCFLCPNCHSQTTTYGGKNKSK